MKSIDRIISEQINRFVNEDIFGETSDNPKKTASENGKAKAKERNKEYIKRMGTQNNASDRQKAANTLNDRMTNNYEIARQMFRNGENGNYSTVDSLASALRKKGKHLPGANGGHLHLYQSEANGVNHTQGE